MILNEILGSRPALVVIDCQNKFVSDRPDIDEAVRRTVLAVNRLLYAFRAAGRPVIFIEKEGEPYGMVYKGDDGDALFPGLIRRPGETTVHKKHMNSFLESTLEEEIVRSGSDCIILCGTVTQFCVMSTYF